MRKSTQYLPPFSEVDETSNTDNSTTYSKSILPRSLNNPKGRAFEETYNGYKGGVATIYQSTSYQSRFPTLAGSNLKRKMPQTMSQRQKYFQNFSLPYANSRDHSRSSSLHSIPISRQPSISTVGTSASRRGLRKYHVHPKLLTISQKQQLVLRNGSGSSQKYARNSSILSSQKVARNSSLLSSLPVDLQSSINSRVLLNKPPQNRSSSIFDPAAGKAKPPGLLSEEEKSLRVVVTPEKVTIIDPPLRHKLALSLPSPIMTTYINQNGSAISTLSGTSLENTIQVLRRSLLQNKVGILPGLGPEKETAPKRNRFFVNDYIDEDDYFEDVDEQNWVEDENNDDEEKIESLIPLIQFLKTSKYHMAQLQKQYAKQVASSTLKTEKQNPPKKICYDDVFWKYFAMSISTDYLKVEHVPSVLGPREPLFSQPNRSASSSTRHSGSIRVSRRRSTTRILKNKLKNKTPANENSKKKKTKKFRRWFWFKRSKKKNDADLGLSDTSIATFSEDSNFSQTQNSTLTFSVQNTPETSAESVATPPVNKRTAQLWEDAKSILDSAPASAGSALNKTANVQALFNVAVYDQPPASASMSRLASDSSVNVSASSGGRQDTFSSPVLECLVVLYFDKNGIPTRRAVTAETVVLQASGKSGRVVRAARTASLAARNSNRKVGRTGSAFGECEPGESPLLVNGQQNQRPHTLRAAYGPRYHLSTSIPSRQELELKIPVLTTTTNQENKSKTSVIPQPFKNLKPIISLDPELLNRPLPPTPDALPKVVKTSIGTAFEKPLPYRPTSIIANPGNKQQGNSDASNDPTQGDLFPRPPHLQPRQQKSKITVSTSFESPYPNVVPPKQLPTATAPLVSTIQIVEPQRPPLSVSALGLPRTPSTPPVIGPTRPPSAAPSFAPTPQRYYFGRQGPGDFGEPEESDTRPVSRSSFKPNLSVKAFHRVERPLVIRSLPEPPTPIIEIPSSVNKYYNSADACYKRPSDGPSGFIPASVFSLPQAVPPQPRKTQYITPAVQLELDEMDFELAQELRDYMSAVQCLDTVLAIDMEENEAGEQEESDDGMVPISAIAAISSECPVFETISEKVAATPSFNASQQLVAQKSQRQDLRGSNSMSSVLSMKNRYNANTLQLQLKQVQINSPTNFSSSSLLVFPIDNSAEDVGKSNVKPKREVEKLQKPADEVEEQVLPRQRQQERQRLGLRTPLPPMPPVPETEQLAEGLSEIVPATVAKLAPPEVKVLESLTEVTTNSLVVKNPGVESSSSPVGGLDSTQLEVKSKTNWKATEIGEHQTGPKVTQELGLIANQNVGFKEDKTNKISGCENSNLQRQPEFNVISSKAQGLSKLAVLPPGSTLVTRTTATASDAPTAKQPQHPVQPQLSIQPQTKRQRQSIIGVEGGGDGDSADPRQPSKKAEQLGDVDVIFGSNGGGSNAVESSRGSIRDIGKSIPSHQLHYGGRSSLQNRRRSHYNSTRTATTGATSYEDAELARFLQQTVPLQQELLREVEDSPVNSAASVRAGREEYVRNWVGTGGNLTFGSSVGISMDSSSHRQSISGEGFDGTAAGDLFSVRRHNGSTRNVVRLSVISDDEDADGKARKSLLSLDRSMPGGHRERSSYYLSGFDYLKDEIDDAPRQPEGSVKTGNMNSLSLPKVLPMVDTSSSNYDGTSSDEEEKRGGDCELNGLDNDGQDYGASYRSLYESIIASYEMFGSGPENEARELCHGTEVSSRGSDETLSKIGAMSTSDSSASLVVLKVSSQEGIQLANSEESLCRTVVKQESNGSLDKTSLGNSMVDVTKVGSGSSAGSKTSMEEAEAEGKMAVGLGGDVVVALRNDETKPNKSGLSRVMSKLKRTKDMNSDEKGSQPAVSNLGDNKKDDVMALMHKINNSPMAEGNATPVQALTKVPGTTAKPVMTTTTAKVTTTPRARPEQRGPGNQKKLAKQQSAPELMRQGGRRSAPVMAVKEGLGKTQAQQHKVQLGKGQEEALQRSQPQGQMKALQAQPQGTRSGGVVGEGNEPNRSRHAGSVGTLPPPPMSSTKTGYERSAYGSSPGTGLGRVGSNSAAMLMRPVSQRSEPGLQAAHFQLLQQQQQQQQLRRQQFQAQFQQHFEQQFALQMQMRRQEQQSLGNARVPAMVSPANHEYAGFQPLIPAARRRLSQPVAAYRYGDYGSGPIRGQFARQEPLKRASLVRSTPPVKYARPEARR